MLSDLSLVPNSGIQFVTYAFNANKVRMDYSFVEQAFTKTLDDHSKAPAWRLLQGWTERANERRPSPGKDGFSYDVTIQQAFEPFIDKWVPVPYLRARDTSLGTMRQGFDEGPTNWVRVRVIHNPDRRSDEDATHIAVFAFDTRIDDYSTTARTNGPDGEVGSGDPYNPDTEPTAYDIEKRKQFCLVSDVDTINRFLIDERTDPQTGAKVDYQSWVVDWLERLFVNSIKAKKGRNFDEKDDIPYKLEHITRWIVFLDIIRRAAEPPPVRFFDTISDDHAYAPVEVDLILDVGNSRTCGMLIEDFPSEDLPGINNTITLGLRDLGQPEKVYLDPFDSHIEFSQASFGSDELSNASAREGAFFWPSIVRVGKEATRLRNEQDDGSVSLRGMSSPKRYLWDVSEAVQPWRFPERDYIGDWQPMTFATMRQYLNARGDVRSQVKMEGNSRNGLFRKLYGSDFEGEERERPSRYFKYSRSSMYTFMLAELIWQAYVQINNPQERAKRKQAEMPRLLRQIVLTLPTAMPAREQMIMQMRAQSAVTLLWEMMRWNVSPPPGTDRPRIEVLWDEASCVHMVWLYGETTEKLGGDIKGLFELLGRPRQFFTADDPPAPDAPERESLRIASIDIGGGTTDLMITTYFQEDSRAITPTQTFRESIRIAGDDVLQAIIERVIIPAIEQHFVRLGVKQPNNKLKELFRGDRADLEIQQTNLRRHFVHRVLRPAALSIMAAYERMTPYDYQMVESRPLPELIGDFASIPESTLDYLSEPVVQELGVSLDWNAIEVAIDFNRAREAVTETLGAVLENLCEAINHFDCDVVLLSGRPSQLPAINQLVADALAVPPNRLIAMHRYRPGPWYPFLERNGMRIADPKTTTVVGGTVCALADRRIRNFMVYTNKLQMRSTAKYIGVLEGNGKLAEDGVLFDNVDKKSLSNPTAAKSVNYFSRMAIGYRQLPYERWAATPFYELHEMRVGNTIPKPVAVTLIRDEVDQDIENDPRKLEKARMALLFREASLEGLSIGEALSAGATEGDRSDVRKSLRLTFRTLDSNASYWLDSGTLWNKNG